MQIPALTATGLGFRMQSSACNAPLSRALSRESSFTIALLKNIGRRGAGGYEDYEVSWGLGDNMNRTKNRRGIIGRMSYVIRGSPVGQFSSVVVPYVYL